MQQSTRAEVEKGTCFLQEAKAFKAFAFYTAEDVFYRECLVFAHKKLSLPCFFSIACKGREDGFASFPLILLAFFCWLDNSACYVAVSISRISPGVSQCVE
jgi:hypothetical protein